MKPAILSATICALLLIQCTRKNAGVISYGTPEPDSVALPFLPGIVSSDSLDFNAAFSPDGKTFYFGRSGNGKWKIYQSWFDGKSWTPPVLAPFSESERSQADPFITPDGTLYYISNRPKNDRDTLADYDIWRVRPLANNTWSPPENVQGVNSDSTEYYVSLAPNGNLYFASNRAGGYGQLDIYVSRLVDGTYTTPENLGPAINTPEDEHDPLVMGDEKFIIFASSNRPDGYGQADLYYSEKGDDENWSVARNMGPRFNTPTYEYCPNLSPDLKYFFFSSAYDVKWINADYLPTKN